MAGYSENREDNLDMKALRKALSVVDDNIIIPDSVRGSALRQKLDAVQPPEPAEPDKKSGIVFGLKWFSLQSGLTYAAAFALIVGLFYGLGMHQQPDVVDGRMPLPDGQEGEAYEIAEFQLLMDSGDVQTGGMDVMENPVTAGGAETYGLDIPNSAPVPDTTPVSPRMMNPVSGGVGGGSEATKLGSKDGYSYAWRTNDAADPDKGSYPITVEVINDDEAQPVATIDIPDIQSIENVHFSDGTLSLVGTTGSGVVTRTYSIQSPEAPVELVVLEQPGAYVSSRLHNNVVHTVTYSEEVSSIACETEELPGAVSADTACVVSAVDTEALAYNQKAFLGADQDISLLDRGAYITYEAEVPEGDAPMDSAAPTEETAPEEAPAEQGESATESVTTDDADVEETTVDEGEPIDETATYYAQIVLQGTDISLGSVTP